MKRLNWFLIGAIVLCLTTVLLTGCGVDQEDYDALQAENADLAAELAAAQSDLASLQTDYDTLNADYQAASSELSEIQGVYPPRYFSDYDEFEDWVDEHCPITYSSYNILKNHLELQEKALADGYIWSVFTESDKSGIISCVVAGDSIYFVWLEGYIEWVCFK